MGNTVPAVAHSVKQSIAYVLFAEEGAGVWRYPHTNLQREAQHVALDVETILEIMHVRLSMVWEQLSRIAHHTQVIVERLGRIAYRLWRIVYHLLQLADEVVAEIVEMSMRVPRVLLELLERARERCWK